ncbi:MAG: tRNA (adenosine(37)-N6)-threonylcarbamoyltransferase complex dimerization subunit type 1 TsaB [Phycisphaerae bacterium]
MSDSPHVLIAIESSVRPGDVALFIDGKLAASRALSYERPNADALFPTIRDLLAAHGLTPRDIAAFAYSAGPGSFTGLRVATTVARMLNSVLGCLVVSVATLDVLAIAAFSCGDSPPDLVVTVDAKASRAVAARYRRLSAAGAEDIEFEIVDPPAVRTTPWFAALPACVGLTGAGVPTVYARDRSAQAWVAPPERWQPSAVGVGCRAVHLLARSLTTPPDQIVPLYVRPPECEEVYERRRREARERSKAR